MRSVETQKEERKVKYILTSSDWVKRVTALIRVIDPSQYQAKAVALNS